MADVRLQGLKRNKQLYQKLSRESSKLSRAAQTGGREDVLDCLGSMRGALELCVSGFEKGAGVEPQGTLHERILLLEQKGVLTDAQANDAHRIRMITNEAVHFYGNTQDSQTHKYLEHMDKKGLVMVADELFEKLVALGEAGMPEEAEMPPKAETIKKEYPVASDRDPFLYVFLGIMLIALVALFLAALFH